MGLTTSYYKDLLFENWVVLYLYFHIQQIGNNVIKNKQLHLISVFLVSSMSSMSLI
jgi:hypothetical protein